MFPFRPGDELVFGTPTTSQGDRVVEDDLTVDRSFMEGCLISFATSSNDRQLGQTTNFGFPQTQTESSHECSIRKAMHRDIEKKRRQEMSNLYASLRSLLPPEQNKYKGKSSVCDQMQEAVDHIKQMQKSIQELSIRRDNLKKLSNSSGGNLVESSNGRDNFPKRVMVNLIQDGLEILITTNSDFGLSRVLAELVGSALDVVNFVSTGMNGGFLHKIQIEARDATSFDVSVLQNRLTNAIK